MQWKEESLLILTCTLLEVRHEGIPEGMTLPTLAMH